MSLKFAFPGSKINYNFPLAGAGQTFCPCSVGGSLRPSEGQREAAGSDLPPPPTPGNPQELHVQAKGPGSQL